MAEHPPTFEVLPSARTYVHLPCGTTTTVGGRDFKLLCDPYSRVFHASTVCIHCDRDDALDRSAWSDTKESLAAYRTRLRASVSRLYGTWRWLVRALCFVVIPAGLVFAAARSVPEYPTVASASAALAGLIVGALLYGAYRARVRDFRQFR